MRINDIKNAVNSKEEIQKRITDGRIGWVAPVSIVFVRTILAVIFQGITILIFWFQGHPSPIIDALPWWTVYGTFVDVGCLALLIWLAHHEGIYLFDLISLNRKKLITDILLGLGIMVLVFPITIFGGSSLASLLVYKSMHPQLPDGAFWRHLPLWAMLYTRLIWWVIWSLTEELTYQGYALPRLQLLSGNTWASVLWVSFGWSLQHCFLPLFYDMNHFIWIFITFIPLTIVMQLLYLRFRRLAPLIAAHWAMDLISTFMIIT